LAPLPQEDGAQRLSSTPWHIAAHRLFEALQWHLSPQVEGCPHVYHGSLWRSRAREEHLSRVKALCPVAEDGGARTHSDRLWGDLLFCYSLWLEYNPHTANWGTCVSYGLPPNHFCWHNRWREDLRHVVTELARKFSHWFDEGATSAKERSCATCLLAVLDHVLSWSVTSPNIGHSNLIGSDAYVQIHSSFCRRLSERFAFAWASAQAPPEANLDSESFGPHFDLMVERDVSDTFRDVW